MPSDYGFDEDDELEDEDSEGDEDEDGSDAAGKSPKKSKSKCDGGRTCVCHKPADELPDHEFLITYAGFRKWIAQLSMGPLRDPDVFGMYTYNDREFPLRPSILVKFW